VILLASPIDTVTFSNEESTSMMQIETASTDTVQDVQAGGMAAWLDHQTTKAGQQMVNPRDGGMWLVIGIIVVVALAAG